ncbi:uncharacterized protein METZ01_LOCUS338334 [marine metagenome]|uniref:Uncharacterized protein n=1 Tax=marine metagenome TaxID=408172 RepID=A0A382QKP8_9ZZZZ
MAPRDNQRMNRRLRINILKTDHIFILKNYFRVNIT